MIEPSTCPGCGSPVPDVGDICGRPECPSAAFVAALKAGTVPGQRKVFDSAEADEPTVRDAR